MNQSRKGSIMNKILKLDEIWLNFMARKYILQNNRLFVMVQAFENWNIAMCFRAFFYTVYNLSIELMEKLS